MRLILIVIRQPQCQQAIRSLIQILSQQLVVALFRAAPGPREQTAEMLVTRQVLNQQDQPGPLVYLHLTTDNQFKARRLCGLPGTHNTRQRALISNRQSRVTMLVSALKQLLRTRGSALKAEIGEAVQFRVRATHANHPCTQN